jgi:hypothetical protein
MAYSETKALNALSKASDIVSRPGAKGRRAGKADLGDLCKKYQSARPMLQLALPLIERIPVFGKKVSDAVRFLMGIADVACPVS